MLCSNCGKNEANVHYTHVINGDKTEYNLCDECAKKLGIDEMDFSMPISFSNFLGDFFEEDSLLPSFSSNMITKCPKCGLTYDEFAKNGKFGCGDCYETFADRIESVLKNLHGSAKHRGRAPQRLAEKTSKLTEKDEKENKNDVKVENKPLVDKTMEQIDKLNNDIKLAIKEERYEDAAKIRDEIKKLEEKKNK
ncbi:MAG: UvrB/UvrC motif-containing protein [Clostridia bacterium]|nr:UvrB/UvrC motif-containing protein [Clostridia bacterium]